MRLYTLTATGSRVFKLIRIASWHFTDLISITVENAAPTNIILTFPTSNTSLTTSSFSVTINGWEFLIDSISWNGNILTIVLPTEVLDDDVIIVTFTQTSDTATVTNNVKWYLAGGINPANVLGAWKAVGAASKAASLVNLVTPGTGNLIETGTVSWNKIYGWSGFADAVYLFGPEYRSNTYSFNASFIDRAGASDNLQGRVFSSEPDDGQSGAFLIPAHLSNLGYIRRSGGSNYVTITEYFSGAGGCNQTNAFVNGADAGSVVIDTAAETIDEFKIGGRASAQARPYQGYITAVVVYRTSITNAQMIAVQNRMRAENFAIRMRDFSDLTRYASNPIIVHNTETWNVYGSDTPYIKTSQKIGDYYYAPTQVAEVINRWDDIALYRSLDLINWDVYGSNPIISNTPGAWDDTHILHPSVIRVGSLWYLYYSGRTNDGIKRIGLATSSDFLTWTKHPSNPVLNSEACELPSVILIGSTYYMYFINPTYTINTGIIKYATSSDGISWTVQGQCIFIRSKSILYNYAVIDPWVYQRADGIYEMFMSRVTFDPVTQDICYATSYDGINWYIHESVVLSKGVDSWEAGMVGDPVIIDNPITKRGNLFYVGIASGGGITSGSDGGLVIL